jgi:hypothetical protein
LNCGFEQKVNCRSDQEKKDCLRAAAATDRN